MGLPVGPRVGPRGWSAPPSQRQPLWRPRGTQVVPVCAFLPAPWQTSRHGEGCFRLLAGRKASCRGRGSQRGHAGSGPESLPLSRWVAVVDHVPEASRCRGNPLVGVHPVPHPHQRIKIPPITAKRMEQRLPHGLETSRPGPGHRSFIGTPGSAFPFSFGTTPELLNQRAGVLINGGAIGRSAARSDKARTVWAAGIDPPCGRAALRVDHQRDRP